MTIQLIIDSACDLPQTIIKDYGIEVLPFNIHIGNETYQDRVNIKTEDVYTAMKEGKVPTTSQVSLKEFQEVFTRHASEGKDCIYISFSSKLSGAYQAGKLMAAQVEEEFPGINIDVLDSKAGSVATGIIVYKAAKLIREGASREEIIDKVQFWADHIEHLFILDDLKTLVRGGRISKTKSLIGNMLNIKPILHLENGEIKLLEKVRGTQRAINRLIDLLKERSFNIKDQLIGISHADDLVNAEKLKNKIEELGGEIFCIELISSVLGAHLGIGGIGVFFLNEV